MTAKPTSLSLNDGDKKLLSALRETTGIRSTTEVVRYALKRAAEPTAPSPATDREEKLKAALEAHRVALKMWEPSDFAGVRAKAAAEESLSGL